MNPIWLLAPMMLCWRPAYDGATRGWCEQRWTMRMLQPAHPAYVECPRPSSKAAQQVARVGRDDRLEPTGRAGRRSPASWGKFLFAPWSLVTKDGIPHPMPPLLRPMSSTKKRHNAQCRESDQSAPFNLCVNSNMSITANPRASSEVRIGEGSRSCSTRLVIAHIRVGQ